MRSGAFLVLGVLFLVLQGNLYPLLGSLGLHGATPSFVLPLLIFLGVHEASTVRGAGLAFGLGYATDLLASAPIGLFAMVSVVVWWLARTAGVRLAAQTWWTKVALSFGFSLVESVLVLVLLAIFGSDPQRPLEIATVALPHAAATALCALLVFPLAQRLHQGSTPARSFEGLMG
jgi:rod shape-determining protein MreD